MSESEECFEPELVVVRVRKQLVLVVAVAELQLEILVRAEVGRNGVEAVAGLVIALIPVLVLGNCHLEARLHRHTASHIEGICDAGSGPAAGLGVVFA